MIKSVESLQISILFTTIAGIFYGGVSLLVFGPILVGGPKDWGILHLIISILGPMFFASTIPNSILLRQLAMPVAIIGAIYSYSNVHGHDLYLYLNLCGLTGLTMIIIALTEARLTTGKFIDFWRSFLFHPLIWTREFGIKTYLK